MLCAAALGVGLAAASVAHAQRSHTVRPGQSMSRIARRYHVSVWDLALANRMRPSSPLRAGQSLEVPPRGVTYVRPGQTLSHIARDNHCTVDDLRRVNRLRRRGIRAGQRLMLPGFEPEADADRDWGTPDHPGQVRVRRREGVQTLQLRDAEGRVTAEALSGLGEVMRRHEEDPAEMPHPRLALLLAAISDHFGGREIQVISGRREAGGYTRESSRHTSGHATDIRVRGVPRRAVWDYCRTLADTGCGYYPRSTFVHVDVRSRAGQWVDWSGPGDRARYGNLGGPWPSLCRRASNRRNRRCTRESRRVSAPTDVPTEVLLTDAARQLMPTVPAILAPGEEPEELPSEDDEDDDEVGEEPDGDA